jgi:hypothetical protein
MRSSFVFALMSLTACTSDSGSDLQTDPVFTITSSPLQLEPGQEVTKCFYFTMPNTETVSIAKWVSDMTPGSHHMIMFLRHAGAARRGRVPR